MFCEKIKNLASATIFSKLNIEPEHINAVNRTNLKILAFNANHSGASGRPLNWHNFTSTQIRPLDQPLVFFLEPRQNNLSNPEAYSEPCQTSKMKHFLKIVNS